MLPHLLRTTFCCVLAGPLSWLFLPSPVEAAEWSVASTNALQLNTTNVNFSVSELSGVTYLGPSPQSGKHRFLAVQDDDSQVVAFDVALDLTGNLVSAVAVDRLLLNKDLDFEGIVQIGDSLFISEEGSPGVREFDSTTGNEIQNISIPTVFNNRRSNKGFESLAHDSQNSRLWTANEAALTVDGPVPTASAGSMVRLLELQLNGNSATAGSQFAYEVEPIHGTASSSARSGLVDLLSMPDGSLLALERSLASAIPPYNSRIFEIDFDGATDISAAAFDAGLIGQTYTPLGKELLWSGPAGGGFGQNMEGLTVGPRLPNGDYLLLGVVDDGDSISSNSIVAFTATPTTPIPTAPPTADFDSDNDIDGTDFLTWQRGYGVTTLAGRAHGDGNQDGTVTSADLSLWQNQFGVVPANTTLQPVPEPATLAMLFVAGVAWVTSRQRS